MALAVVHSRALRGLEAPAVTVEVHLANGLPSFTLVGLADTEVKESRERVRAALQTSGLEFPHNKRITVSLAPADLPKESGRFDLPIALGILAAAGQIDAARLGALRVRRRAVAGRRAAPGARRAGDGAGAAAQRRRRRRARWCCRAPAPTRRRSVGGLAVRGADHLLDVVRALLPGDAADAAALRDAVPLRASPRAGAARPARRQGPGRGQARARDRRGRRPQPADGRPARHRQVDARAAPRRPAAARSAHDEALESAAILSVGRRASSPARWGQRRAARAAPHRVGGGAGRRRLAAAAGRDLARAPRRAVPRRAAGVPARRARGAARAARDRPHRRSRARRGRPSSRPRFQLVAAMNPCPCGQLGNPAQRLPLHARRGAALPGRASAGRCSTASTCRSRCRRSPPSSSRPRPTASRAASVAQRVVRRAGRSRSLARARATRELAGDALDRHCRARRRRVALPAGSDDAARLVGAQLSPRAARRAHDRRPRRQRRASRPPHLAEAIQYRRVLLTQ